MSFVLTEAECLYHYGHPLPGYGPSLNHYGVPGMKWGKKKFQDGKSARREAAGNRIEKSGGSKTKAVAKIATASIAKTIGSTVGSNLAGNLAGNLTVANGLSTITKTANFALTVRDINRIVNVIGYKAD